VLGDLDEHGLGVPAQLRPELEAWRPPGITCRLGDATLTLRPAVEYWPLVGDVASQERAGARIVDASTQRWEVSLDGPAPIASSCRPAARRPSPRGGPTCTRSATACARSASAAGSTRR